LGEPDRAGFLDSSALPTVNRCHHRSAGMAWSSHPQHRGVPTHGVHTCWVQCSKLGLAGLFPRVAAVS